MKRAAALVALRAEIEACHACSRLVAHREQIGVEKRRAYRAETYWSKPVPGFGDVDAPIVLVGLAPGAHGANRTGRMFTGDRSGDFLYPALHRAGLASQPASRSRDDGLALSGAFITAPVRCVPPDNLPSRDEIATCARWFEAEIALLSRARVFLALGAIAWSAVHRALDVPRPPPFSHGAESEVARRGKQIAVLASYHVSQQNTQTGRLTEAMFDAVLTRAHALARTEVR